jgi:hypothetical protein
MEDMKAVGEAPVKGYTVIDAATNEIYTGEDIGVVPEAKEEFFNVNFSCATGAPCKLSEWTILSKETE